MRSGSYMAVPAQSARVPCRSPHGAN